MGIQADIMDKALHVYLGSEAQWCTGWLAKDAEGRRTEYCDHNAVSHCAEGAIRAAAFQVAKPLIKGNDAVTLQLASGPVLRGVEKVLVEQNPALVEAYSKVRPIGISGFTEGNTLPMFNDGVIDYHGHDAEGDDIMTVVPGVGYQGIRAAFEKYLAECQEKDL